MSIKLTDFIKQLQALEASGGGDKAIYASVGASKAKYEILSGPYITDYVDDGGPLDLDSAEYICILTGN